jgi:hypothetical protein
MLAFHITAKTATAAFVPLRSQAASCRSLALYHAHETPDSGKNGNRRHAHVVQHLVSGKIGSRLRPRCADSGTNGNCRQLHALALHCTLRPPGFAAPFTVRICLTQRTQKADKTATAPESAGRLLYERHVSRPLLCLAVGIARSGPRITTGDPRHS